ncbi:hypothetical protein ElyMa_005125500, partial [Elysia marginata]
DYNLTDKRDFKLYSSSFDKRIGVKIFDIANRDGITVHNGPTTDFFDMVKGCNPKPDDQKEFISYNTDIVTVELSPEECVPTGTFNVIDTISNQKLRNLFCFLQVEASNSSVTSLEAETNLNVSDSVILKKYVSEDYTTEVARLASLDDREVELRFSTPYKVYVDVILGDSSEIFTDEPTVLLSVNKRHRYLTYNVPDQYAMPRLEQDVTAPSFLIIDSSVHCTWKVIPTPDPASKEPGYIKLTVYGVASSVYNSQVCAKLQLLASDRRGNQKKFYKSRAFSQNSQKKTVIRVNLSKL